MRALTDQLAPPLPTSNPLHNPHQPPPRPPPPQLDGAPPGYDAPPSYNEAQATMGAHGEVGSMWAEKNNCFAQVIILGEQGARDSNGQQAMQGEVAEVLLTMEGVQVGLLLDTSLSIQSFDFSSHQSSISISRMLVFPV